MESNIPPTFKPFEPRWLEHIIVYGSLLIIFMAFVFNACDNFNRKYNLEPDHFAEEMTERVIEKVLDLPKDSLDLSKENRDGFPD